MNTSRINFTVKPGFAQRAYTDPICHYRDYYYNEYIEDTPANKIEERLKIEDKLRRITQSKIQSEFVLF
jgi:hypothetical protein